MYTIASSVVLDRGDMWHVTLLPWQYHSKNKDSHGSCPKIQDRALFGVRYSLHDLNDELALWVSPTYSTSPFTPTRSFQTHVKLSRPYSTALY